LRRRKRISVPCHSMSITGMRLLRSKKKENKRTVCCSLFSEHGYVRSQRISPSPRHPTWESTGHSERNSEPHHTLRHTFRPVYPNGFRIEPALCYTNLLNISRNQRFTNVNRAITQSKRRSDQTRAQLSHLTPHRTEDRGMHASRRRANNNTHLISTTSFNTLQ
jgi:hypothetical protein